MNSDGSMNGGTSSEGAGLPLEDVGRLVDLLAKSGVGEIRVKQGELEITVKAKAAAPQPRSVPAEEVVVEPGATSVMGTERPAEQNGAHAVRSPVVGTFYRAPGPGEEPYVEVGDRVVEGQTLCIVEAMKLMNEIPSDVSGEVVEVLASNAEGVEYDQPLFHVRTVSSE